MTSRLPPALPPAIPARTSILSAIAVSHAAGKPVPPTISPACAWRSKSKTKTQRHPDEQEILCRFTGFGASELANALFRRRETFAAAGRTSATNWSSSYRATHSQVFRVPLNTPILPGIFHQAIWRAVQHMGFSGGPILEPGCGSGLFFALCPKPSSAKPASPHRGRRVNGAHRRSPLSERWIRHEDFTKARLPQTYALAIGILRSVIAPYVR